MKRYILVLTLLFVIVLSGCSNKNNQINLSDTEDQIRGFKIYESDEVLVKAFNQNVTYEVLEISWSGDFGVAQVKVTTPDLKQIISICIQSAIDECGIEDYDILLNKTKEKIISTLNSPDYLFVERVVEMKVEKNIEGYILISNEDFEKAVSGNLEEVFIQTLMEGNENEK